MLLTIEECIELSELTEDETLAIAEHKELPDMLAVELGNYLVQTSEGEKRIRHMIADEIATAREEGNIEQAAKLKQVLKYFLENHPQAK